MLVGVVGSIFDSGQFLRAELEHLNRRARGDLRENFQEVFLAFLAISVVSMFWFVTQQPRFRLEPAAWKATPVQNTVSTAGPAAPRVRIRSDHHLHRREIPLHYPPYDYSYSA